MSKRQEKIENNIKEQQEFIAIRRGKQLAMFEQAYLVGLQIYEDNKDKMSPEEIDAVERMKEEQLTLLKKLQHEANPNPEA